MYKNALEEARIYLKSIGKTEHHLEGSEQAVMIFNELQEKRKELNLAKVAAMKEVSRQFDDELNEIEELYSSMLRLIA